MVRKRYAGNMRGWPRRIPKLATAVGLYRLTASLEVYTVSRYLEAFTQLKVERADSVRAVEMFHQAV